MLKSFKPREVRYRRGRRRVNASHATGREEILEMRKRLGLTQQELADKLSVSQQLVSYWEAGQREPNEDSQALLAEFEREMLRCERKPTTQPPQTIPDIPVERKLDQLLDVISLYPNPTLHARAANLFLQIGKPDEAENHINETLKARPDSPPFMMIQARCYLMKNEFSGKFDTATPAEKAVPILEQLYFLRPYDSNIIARLAQAYHGAGETATAKELLVSAINLSLERGYKNRFLASLLCDMK